MGRILITGMSGVGKSTVISQLTAQGHRAVDLDEPAWSEWVDSADGDGPSALYPGKDWVWREDRVESLLANEQGDVLFVGGCAPNLAKFRDQFDTIVLLSAPAAVMVQRLTERESNSYGKHPGEITRSVHFKETIEPRLRLIAHIEIDTSAPIDRVVAAVLHHADRSRRRDD